MQKKDISYLGEPPWSFEDVRKAYFDNSSAASDYIYSRLEGYKIESRQAEISLTFSIFSDSVDDLLASIHAFKSYEDRKKLWNNDAKFLVNSVLVKIHRGIFCSCASAMALVDHMRKHDKHLKVKGYREKVKEVFGVDSDHSFMQSLRNYSIHSKISEARWNINMGAENKKIYFFLLKKRFVGMGWLECGF